MNCCEIGTYECYIDIKIPLHMHQYIKNRKDKGFSGVIQIDKCIKEEIEYLHSLWITTYGCCCGHNVNIPYVNVDDSDVSKMIELGYKLIHKSSNAFRLKFNNK